MQNKKSTVNTTKNVSSSKNAQNKFWHTKGKMVEAATAKTAGAVDTAAATGLGVGLVSKGVKWTPLIWY